MLQDVTVPGPVEDAEERRDLFISYAGPDRPWAEWAGAQLEAAGYSVLLDVWDWAAGDNFVLRISQGLRRADRVLALWSQAYFEADRFTATEWTAALADSARESDRGRLIPVRVAAVVPPQILQPLIYRDVFGLTEAAARAELLAAVVGPSRSDRERPFPGEGTVAERIEGPRVPGSMPRVWNVPPRNPAFTGRESLVAGLREHFCGGQRSRVQALNGIGGVGKTQLAIEYAYLFAGTYDLVWWVDAEPPGLIGDQVTRLAQAASWASAEASVSDAWEHLRDRLRRTDRWLLVYDNVPDPGAVREWLPDGQGHVIITSRHSGFPGLAQPVQVQVFTRTESIDLLHAHLPQLPKAEAQALAAAVGDLPLALAQAAGLLAETTITVGEYLHELGTHGREILCEGKPLGYPVSLAAGIEISMGRLAEKDPAALDLLRLASVLAAEPIPLDWLRTAPPDVLPANLSAVVGRPLALRKTLARLTDLGLAQVTSESVQLHPLTQAVLRDQRPPDQLAADRLHAVRLLAANTPTSGREPATWPAWAAMLPHLLALQPSTAPTAIRGISLDALWYLLMRGEYHTALPLAQAWHIEWLRTDGCEDKYVLSAAYDLAVAYRYLGRHQEAYGLDWNTLGIRRRLLGPDHPNTLNSATALAIDLMNLGRHQEAYELDRNTWNTRRRVLGPDHPDTLSSASSLAIDLTNLGRHQEAYELDRDTLDARRTVLGPDHPNTLNSANNLAIDLRRLGRHQEAYELDRDTLDARRRILGPDHPDTLSSAHNLGVDLTNLGRDQEAYDLDRDTLIARRRILGPDHPNTLNSASSLAVDLTNLGRYQEADELKKASAQPSASSN